MNRKKLTFHDRQKAVKAIRDLTREKREHIMEALERGRMDYVDCYALYPRRELQLPKEILEKLEYTSLKRSLEHGSYANDLGELWTTLDENQIHAFFNEMVESHDKVAVRIGLSQVTYRRI